MKIVAAGAVLTGLVVLGTAPAAGPRLVTYAEHVAPILRENCVTCHRAGGAGPFPLVTYEDARRYADLIAEVTRDRYMPPWLPERGLVSYAGERGLSDDQISTIQQWVTDGTPAGDLSALPPTRPPATTWPLGPPDVVVQFDPYQTPASGRDVYRNLVAPIPVRAPGYVYAIDVQPGDPSVVHHARVMVDTTRSSREADGRDPGVGFDGMDVVSNAGNPDGFFLGWTPGHIARPAPAGLAWPVRPGTDFVIQLHLRPVGTGRTVAPRIGLYLRADAPAHRSTLLLLGSETIDIPTGETAYVVRDSFELPTDVRAFGVYPHAHYLAQRMEGFARLPNGDTKWLLRIADWDFNWQDEYHFAEPVALPRGTVMTMRYTYDNSTANPQNPNTPPRRVRFGPNSTDEMADLVVQIVPDDPAQLAALEEQLQWKYYTAEMAQLALRARWAGDSLAAAGAYDRALAAYRESLQHESDNPVVLASMADVVLKQGDLATARFIAERALAIAEARGNDALVTHIRRVLARTRNP